MHSDSTKSLLLLLSVVCIATGIVFLLDLPSSLSQISPDSTSSPLRDQQEDFHSIEQALNIQFDTHPVTFPDELQSPFRMYTNKPTRPAAVVRRPVAQPQPRTPLQVKGVLTQPSYIVILEDNTGQTYIREKGDKIHEATIIAISRNGVTLRDNQGSYQINVEETP
ncbi:hypothetical protein QA601_14030 [Chitinispirillales bacterium ANBcel5]|uniref:hypothetical protein n=1 Tax=Cellulosispirillum alkaliphilum TaxID=3039283 RepID=UPI002A53197E|nr:hypothetical protein [Chitinispirillales bacterium ANBcel5]